MLKERVRFAPSPTGALHIGGAHTALFNWLYARHTGGVFVLRIEDTDRERSTPEYEQTIMDGMRWLGLKWDEGPDTEGPHGPYRQSQRLDGYTEHAQKLLRERKAYEQDGAVLYRIEPGHTIVLDDMVYGHIEVKSEHASVNQDGTIKDIVIIKRDGMPTYNYAAAIDDHAMDITCVIRGEDHVINTPKQIMLYQALGWEPPKFAHLPMILGKDKKKLSKRHGAASVPEYGELGYTPDGMFNFLGLLGWSPARDLEIFTRTQATELFDVSRITKKPAVFDMDKLNYVNQEHLKSMDRYTRLDMVIPLWQKMGIDTSLHSREYLADAISMLAGRGQTTNELADYTDYFLDFSYVTARYTGADLTDKAPLREFYSALLECTPWEGHAMEAFTKDWCTSHDTTMKILAMPLRMSLTGRKVSPGVFDVAAFLGPAECRRRLGHYGLV